jgi:hypothetical protein
MRRRTVVAGAALIAAIALAGMPVPVGSWQFDEPGNLAPAAFTVVNVPADDPALEARGLVPAAPEPDVAGPLELSGSEAPYVEPGAAPVGPERRPSVDQPTTRKGSAWKKPSQSITGFASFYDNGTTAMRLPRGTIVRICGAGGCIERTITDYGPRKGTGRIIDMYRPDFFKICGCGAWSGTTKVTVSIY